MKIHAFWLKLFSLKSSIYLLISINCVCLISCNDTVEEQMPYSFVNIQISLLDPNYNIPLDNGFRYLNGVGNKGIILYKISNTNYLAFERFCNYKPQSQNCTLEVDSSLLFIKDKCCNSFFKFDGNAFSGPAFRPLVQYNTNIVGQTLYITN